MRIALLDPTGYVERFVSKREAKELLKAGIANSYGCALMRFEHKQIKPLRESSQGATLERLAIEKFPRMCIGGLARTETKPAELQPFHGARAGH